MTLTDETKSGAKSAERREPKVRQPAEDSLPDTADKNPNRRRRRGRGGKSRSPGGQQLQTSQTAQNTQPRPAKGGRRPGAMPRIGVGCVVLRGDTVLLVRERGRWSLPKGGLEPGELTQEGARRETWEETGLHVEVRELAFVVEFSAHSWGHHLQFFYQARETGGTLGPRDPDHEVQEARFVPLAELRDYMRFRPRLLALEGWLRERRPRHHVFNLDAEPAMLRRRQRPEDGPDSAGSRTRDTQAD